MTTLTTQLAALDKAWRRYNHGSGSFDAARLAMLDAGVATLAEAAWLLDSPQPPSQGYLAVAP